MPKEPNGESQERVWWSESRTINTGPYESVKTEGGYASTPLPGETIEQALQRVRFVVVKGLDRREAIIRARIKI